MSTQRSLSILTIIVLSAGFMAAMPAMAAAPNAEGANNQKGAFNGQFRGGHRGGQDSANRPGVMGRRASTTPLIQGNGQPVIAGTVSAISGSTLTVNTASNIQYTVDAANAKFVKGPNTIALSDVIVGDPVVVQGVTNGTAITASFVIDQAHSAPASGTAGNPAFKPHGNSDFFGQIGSFFKHLFGF